jgi:hypothetical protein
MVCLRFIHILADAVPRLYDFLSVCILAPQFLLFSYVCVMKVDFYF